MRHHPRFERSCEVLLRLFDRDDPVRARLQDISNGGMFIEVDEPPSYGTSLRVELDTPSGTIALPATVVHVLDRTTAEAYGRSPGVGLEFSGMNTAERVRLETFIEALAGGLDGEAPARLVPDPHGPAAIRVATRVLDHCENDDLYGAVGVDPTVDRDVLYAALDATIDDLAISDDISPALLARIGHARSMAKRIFVLMHDEDRRLHYDFRRGHLAIEERLARASKQDAERLHRVWHHVFRSAGHQAITHAKEALRCEARGAYDAAFESGAKALESDPFNLDLRAAVDRWSKRAA